MKKFIFLMLATATLSATPQAIVFDFGGVMTGEPNREVVIQFLCESFQSSLTEFEKANQEKRQAVKLGKTDEQFWLEFADKRGIILPDHWTQRFKLVMKEAIGINPGCMPWWIN